MSSSPTYAVIPGMPSTPIAVEIGSDGSSFRRSVPFDTPTSRQPSYPATKSPTANAALRDSTTWLTVWPTIGWPIATGAAYDGSSLIRPRM